MPIFNRKAIEKEIDIAGMTMESHIQDIISLGNISIFSEAGEQKKSFKEKVKETTAKIVAEIKKFCKKIRDTISKKVKDLKRKVDIIKVEKMWKQNINNVVTVTDYADEKKLKKLCGDAITLSRVTSEKVCKLCEKGKMEQIDAIHADYNLKARKIDKQVDECIETVKINLRNDYRRLDEFEKNVETMEAMAVKGIDTVCDMCLKEDESNEEPEVVAKRGKAASILSHIQSTLAAIGKKITSLFSKNSVKIMTAIAAIGAGLHIASKHN